MKNIINTCFVLLIITSVGCSNNQNTKPENQTSENQKITETQKHLKTIPNAEPETPKQTNDANLPNLDNQKNQTSENQNIRDIDFSQFSSVYRFSSKIPENYLIEYVPEIQSINIYDPNSNEATTRNKSQIFIRFFEASDFLTLSTVDILQKSEKQINGHSAVSYEIKKKDNVDEFPYQPNWRNQKHKLTDIRFEPAGKTFFYVFSYNPNLDEGIFNNFLNNLAFYNNVSSLRQPLASAQQRITKKPFGIYVTPQNSPVDPERFSGFHNAVDYEILPGEKNSNVPVMAICGGNLASKKDVSGYGGLITQNCKIDNQDLTILYGHISLGSVDKNIGDYIYPGEVIALLGKGESNETDGERKHLHLGIRKGISSDIKGYIQNESELNNWIDFTKLISQ